MLSIDWVDLATHRKFKSIIHKLSTRHKIDIDIKDVYKQILHQWYETEYLIMMYILTVSIAIPKPFKILHIHLTVYGKIIIVKMKSISIFFLIALVAIAMEICKANYLLVRIDNAKVTGKKGLLIL